MRLVHSVACYYDEIYDNISFSRHSSVNYIGLREKENNILTLIRVI